MNDEARAELESLFSNGEQFEPFAGMQISANMMMSGTAWQDRRFFSFAARAAQVSSGTNTAGKLTGKMALRQLLDEISEFLKSPGFMRKSKFSACWPRIRIAASAPFIAVPVATPARWRGGYFCATMAD